MTSDSTSHSNATREVTVVAPINIALIKYWGKRDEELVLPLNDSISLNIDDLYAQTRIRVGGSIDEDTVTINGRIMDLSKEKRFSRCFAEVRRIGRKRLMGEDGDTQQDTTCFEKFEVVSETNFPVEAGLASSAAGFAAIAFALGHLYKLKNDEVARIARLGSGSACRSVFGGFVHWKAGTRVDGSDSTCEVVASVEHWNSLYAIILVTSHDPKDVGSTSGMQKSVQTSELLSFRAKEVVPRRVSRVTVLRLLKAIASKNFDELATITMLESNQLHAICMDTMPPLKYMNDNSWYLMRLVEALNISHGCKQVAYTFDAGPNCCLLVEKHFVPTVLAALLRYCHLSADLIDKVTVCKAAHEWPQLRTTVENLQEDVALSGIEPANDVVEDVFLSRVGGQPRVMPLAS